MTIELINNGGGKSSLQWTSQSVATAKLMNYLQDAAKGLHLKGVGGLVDEDGVMLPVDTLTNQQLGQVLDAYYPMTTLAEAAAYFRWKAAEDARALADAEIDTRYNGA